MQYVLKILNKALADERKWLRLEDLGGMDVKYKHGARMARERIPQLEAAIATILGDLTRQRVVDTLPHGVCAQAPQPTAPGSTAVAPGRGVAKSQLNLFDSIATLNPKS